MSHWIRSCKSVVVVVAVTFEAVVDDDIFDCAEDCICSGYIKVEKVVVFGRSVVFMRMLGVWSMVGSQLLMSGAGTVACMPVYAVLGVHVVM